MKLRVALSAVALTTGLLVGGTGAATAAPEAAAVSPAEIKTALDSIQPTDAATVIDGIEAANAVLRQFGITPFTPTIGACTDFTFPLAVGGAIAGPYTPPIGDLTVLGVDLNAVRKGEILYGFVPAGVFNDSGNKSGMQVAWLNLSTFQGGLGAPMGGITDTIIDAVNKRIDEAGVPGLSAAAQVVINSTLRPALNLIPQNGVRGGIVDTGAGTVLSAIYGTVQKGDATCLFFPSLGIATAR